MRKLTKKEALNALDTEYGKDCLSEYNVDDVISVFVTDDYSFYTLDESNYRDWIHCDYFKED